MDYGALKMQQCQISKITVSGSLTHNGNQTTHRPPSFQLIFQILPEATLHQLLPESRF
jgi:hypothetical protein